ncbi:MAG: hypothetical protein ACD_73C00551G0002 [uncultured bacterium]|nr:MAG: hypothetical protein ACD_73C00551G0002 [uncultured bacterium]
MTTPIHIIEVTNRKTLSDFLHFPLQIYKEDPHWVCPLFAEEKKRLDQKQNPFFDHAEGKLFVAYQNNTPVGRISAQVDHLHLKIHQDNAGFFGFFECINNQDVANALLDEAGKYLASKKITKIRGPFSFSINDQSGLLIDGFDSPPFVLMPHNAPYYQKLIENYGFTKAKDLFAYSYSTQRPVPDGAKQIADYVASQPGVVVREVNKKNIGQDLKIIIDIFNEAWSKNWGFIPLTDKEIEHTAKDLSLILEPKLALIALVNGVPAAISLALPNINEAIKDLNGRLFPFGLFKLLWRIKTNKIKSARQVLLGIKKEFRKDVMGGLSVLLYVEMHKRSQLLQHWGGETSWTLEDNQKINHGIELMGGKRYKTFRIFEKDTPHLP